MKKRSAMAIAAGLVAALLTGAVALSLGLSDPQPADASSGDRAEPRVRTVHRTVTVHREAKTEEPETVTIVTAGASSPASAESDDGFDDDDLEDDLGSDEHEDEDHEGEDDEDEDHEDDEDDD